jgi:hypothetical protein
MPAPVPTDLSQILLQVRARLVAVLRWPEERVLPIDPDDADLPAPQGTQLCFFWPEIEAAKLYAGAGRLDTRDGVRLAVEIATQLATDPVGSYGLWLLDQQLGHLVARHKVLNALVGFWPGDPAGNVLTDHPFEPAGLSKPRREKKTKGWGYSRVGFQLTYILALDNPAALL